MSEVDDEVPGGEAPSGEELVVSVDQTSEESAAIETAKVDACDPQISDAIEEEKEGAIDDANENLIDDEASEDGEIQDENDNDTSSDNIIAPDLAETEPTGAADAIEGQVTEEASKEEGQVNEDQEMDDVDDEDIQNDATTDPKANDVDESAAVNEKGDMDEEEGENGDEDGKEEAMHYSTRGRQQQKEGSDFDKSLTGFRDNAFDTSNDAEGAIAESQDARTAAATASFLEALTEEERRTRTRFLPEVDGIRMLYKGEVRRDLGLARSAISSSGSAISIKKARGRKPKSLDDENMDMDEDDALAQSEDDRVSDISCIRGSEDFPGPSSTFVAPPGSTVSSSGESTAQVSSKQPMVDSISAFNPPRTPESIGPKKKHRMIRWEQRPQDVEVDLNKYRKTVQKTREELHREERERERIQTVGSILRTHSLNHLSALADESNQLKDELASIQTECVKAAGLLTSRTRSRGAGKGGHSMKDILSVLKSRGTTLDETTALPCKAISGKRASGLGGVSAISFSDWDRSTDIIARPLAEAWILPGDKVQTPYGDGVAIEVFGPSALDINEAPLDDLSLKPTSNNTNDQTMDDVEVKSNDGKASTLTTGQQGKMAKKIESAAAKMKPNETTSGVKKSARNGEKTKEAAATKKDVNPLDHIPPRVCVRLSFGVGFYPLTSVTSKEDPSSYSDAMLVARWKRMVKTASLVGTCVDIAGMEHATEKRESDFDEASATTGSKSGDSDRMEDDDSAKQSKEDGEVIDESGKNGIQNASQPVVDKKKLEGRRLLPFASGMLPTAAGRGALLSTASISELETGLHSALFDGGGKLGMKDNPGVPKGVREWEDQEYESIHLEAKILQLRNELYRQRRIRTLNEKTFITYRDRSHRVESLVKQMKSDLKNLKDRLKDEVTHLGIEEGKAENLLAAYYKGKDKYSNSMSDIAPPPKRKRKVVAKEATVPIQKNTRSRAADTTEGSEGSVVAVGEGVEEYADEQESDEKFSGRLSAEDDTGVDQSSDDEGGDEDRRAKRSRLTQ